MGKDGGFLTPKAIANRIKAKGLQKLRWFCQVCQKQCRDANGFKCHCESESHQRQMAVVAQNTSVFVDNYSRDFEMGFMELLSRRWKTKKVAANIVYNEYIADRTHTHMNATRWGSLTAFAHYLAQSGKVTLEETPKALYLKYIDRGEMERKKKLDERILKDIEADKLEEMLLNEQKRIAQLVESFLAQRRFEDDGDDGEEGAEGKEGKVKGEGAEDQGDTAPVEKVAFRFESKKPILSFQPHSKPSKKDSSSSSSSVDPSLEPPSELALSSGGDQEDQVSSECPLSTSQDPEILPKTESSPPLDSSPTAMKDLVDAIKQEDSIDVAIKQELNQGSLIKQEQQREEVQIKSETPVKAEEPPAPKQSGVKLGFNALKPKTQPFIITKKDSKDRPSSSPFSSTSSSSFVGEKRSRPTSALEEIMEREQKRLKQTQETAPPPQALSTAPAEESWIFPNMIVRCKHKTVGSGKYYNAKARIMSVEGDYVAKLSILDSGDILRLDQQYLQTIIPAIGGEVRIVKGPLKGKFATLKAIDVKSFKATVVLADSNKTFDFEYDQICKHL